MSGPALHKLESHYAIHEGSFVEAMRLTELLEQLVAEEKEKEAAEVADALIEHWELRIIAHADSEEDGFYEAIVKKRPELHDEIVKLTRDHDLIRKIAKQIRGLLASEGVTKDVLDRFNTLLLINAIHSREEEEKLLG